MVTTNPATPPPAGSATATASAAPAAGPSAVPQPDPAANVHVDVNAGGSREPRRDQYDQRAQGASALNGGFVLLAIAIVVAAAVYLFVNTRSSGTPPPYTKGDVATVPAVTTTPAPAAAALAPKASKAGLSSEEIASGQALCNQQHGPGRVFHGWFTHEGRKAAWCPKPDDPRIGSAAASVAPSTVVPAGTASPSAYVSPHMAPELKRGQARCDEMYGVGATVYAGDMIQGGVLGAACKRQMRVK